MSNSESLNPVEVLFESDSILIVNKPSGVPSAPLKGGQRSFAEDVADQFTYLKDLKEIEYGLVHRLDNETSGALVFAKNEAEHQYLKKIWITSETNKVYRSIVTGVEPIPAPPIGIPYPIAHSIKSKKKMVAVTPDLKQLDKRIRGKPREARTEILTAYEFNPPTRSSQKLKYWDISVKITTGVMHQIRVHLSLLGWPVLGDKIYKGLNSERLWLHHFEISFKEKGGNLVEVTAPLPKNWPNSK